MKREYILTGASGHLGGAILRELTRRGETVRALILPDDEAMPYATVTYVRGDMRDVASLLPLFEGEDAEEKVVLHAAGIVSIADKVNDALWDVNVNGTQNILDLCARYAVRKLVYVSSVHALPEGNRWQVLAETDAFSPDKVVGGYAKTKAEATRRTLEAAKAGLNVTVVHPSGIIGPFDVGGNHLVQFIADMIRGTLPAGVRGGYDFVDVRDVAQGCLAAVDAGRPGECYILSNRHYTVKELLGMIRTLNGGRRRPILPMWMAKAAAPLLTFWAKCRHERPLYTRYSLYTLTSNDRFSHDKATRELGYAPRDLYSTLRDTIEWMNREKPPKGAVARPTMG